MSSELATIPTNDLPQLSVAQVKHRMESINDLMRSQMTVGVDFGQIPGTNSKPTLLKSGAEKLCVMFMLDPQFNTVKHFTNDGHLTAESTCTIYHAPSGNRLGSASAICSTKESKYAYRKAARKCPTCGAETIIWSNKNTVYMCIGGDKGGCWAKFPKGDKSIEDQPTGRVSNPDLADAYNTVIRIVEKRALVAAVRLVTGASSTFDEPDILTEDADDHEVSHPTKPVVQQSKPTPPPPASTKPLRV